MDPQNYYEGIRERRLSPQETSIALAIFAVEYSELKEQITDYSPFINNFGISTYE